MQGQQPVPPEYQVKSVFLFNFSQFVEWPPQMLPEPGSPFVIGVVGRDPFGAYLDETVRGETLKGHPMVVKRFGNAEEVDFCHILFVSSGVSPASVVQALPGKGTLTVGESAEFMRTGGMIRFFKQSNRIRFEINPSAAKAADLTISSKLLSLAEISREK